ncbi:MAG: GNAT family N-acetyltransferase [Candidatus Kapabacteria bacterium]|jgi:GNAT superfamily N-acetyltransferase|nr:GNAT family N-acetyltransferase [Candidatus Kapabacteria bacterium]
MNTYTISTDSQKMDVEVIYGYLSQSYWAEGRTKATVEKSLRHSLNFGVFTETGEQVGFARVITDYATFAYLADVFVLEEHRGQNLSKRLMQTIMEHPDLQGLRRWSLATRDAHGLYAQFGFTPLPKPEIWMQKFDAAANPLT